MSINDFVSKSGSFQPKDIEAMSAAFADVCRALGIQEKDAAARETVAARIIDLGYQGIFDPKVLSRRVLRECRTQL